MRWRLVVVDNASSDGTEELVRGIAPDAVVVQMGRNAGYAAGINAGVVRAAPGEAPLLVLNRARGRREAAYLDRFRRVVEEHLGLACRSLGVIPEDRRVRQAIRDGQPFLLAYPRHRIARRFGEWANRVSVRARLP